MMDSNFSSGQGPASRGDDISSPSDIRTSRETLTQRILHDAKPSKTPAKIHSLEGVGLTAADKEKNCDRRRLEDGDRSMLNTMSPQLLGKTVSPFLKDHIPGTYAPLAKATNVDSSDPSQDANSKFCYRHSPDSKCRRAADESKMAMLQSELQLMTADDQQGIAHVWSLFSAAPAKHRDLMLQGIMTQCCFPQLSRVAREVQEQLKIDFLTTLPSELSYNILCNLDAISLCRASQVSRQWRELADDENVWHRICEQHIDRKCHKCGFGLPLLERNRLRNWTKQQKLVKSHQEKVAGPRIPALPPSLPAPNTPRSISPPAKRDASELSDNAETKKRCISKVGAEEASRKAALAREQERRFKGWKSVYKERFRVGSNWRYGRCSVRVFKGHTNGVTCVQLDDNIMATGSYDATIRIWDIATGQEIRQLRGHTRGLRAIQFDEKILVSGSLDGSVKIWNYHTGELLNTLVCDQEGVICVNFSEEWLAVGCIGQMIKVFNLKSKESFCLKGHTDWVNHVKIDIASRTLYSASDDFKVKLWDLDSRQCIRTFEGHVGHVQQVLPLPPDFEVDDYVPNQLDNADALSVASGRSGTPAMANGSPPLSLREPTVQENSQTSSPKEGQLDPRPMYGSRFVDDANIPLPARYILSGGLDSTIRCWDTATGRCVRTFFGHLEGIWSLAGDTLRVVTGANDAMVKIWEPRSGKCERTFTGHRGPVTSVALSDSRLASGSEDGEVRLYSFSDMDGLEEYGTPS